MECHKHLIESNSKARHENITNYFSPKICTCNMNSLLKMRQVLFYGKKKYSLAHECTCLNEMVNIENIIKDLLTSRISKNI